MEEARIKSIHHNFPETIRRDLEFLGYGNGSSRADSAMCGVLLKSAIESARKTGFTKDFILKAVEYYYNQDVSYSDTDGKTSIEDFPK